MSAADSPQQGSDRFDVLITDGIVVDGSGAERFVADVGVRDDVIAAVGDLDGASAQVEVDATGLVVAPGFIEKHSHASTSALRKAESALTQGVTTELVNTDGGGNLDIPERLSIEEGGLGINIGAYVPFNSVWSEVVGLDDRRATPAEIETMRDHVDKGLSDGAWGVSSGLAYTPAAFAQTDQVIEVVEAAQPWRAMFTNHIRNENETVIDATAETIEIGEGAGLVPVITHMKVMGPANWGKSEQTIGLIDEANARGTYTAADVYPYLRSQTGIHATIPPWIKEGGRDEMLARFEDPQLRPQIIEDIEELMHSRVPGPEGVWIRDFGRTLDDVAQEMGVRPGEAVIRIVTEHGNLSCIWTFGDEADLHRIMKHPNTAIASDGGASTSETTHPRHYGTQPRVLAQFVRETGVLSLEEAVRKMTGLPATLTGMVKRGFIAPGMTADLAIFDADSVIDRATFEQPKQFAEGIEHVLIGGEFALKDGAVTDEQHGKALRRTGNMPSRPMTGDASVDASAKGRLNSVDGDGKATLTFNAAARDGDTTGKLVFNGQDGLTLRSLELGRLQVTDGWASVTGRGQVAGGDGERTFLITVDESDPFVDGRTTVTVEIEGGERFKGTLTGSSSVDKG